MANFEKCLNFLIIFASFSIINFVQGKNQYVLPLNMGMKVSIPYDIANIFNRFPIQGGVSVFLAIATLSILFFGVITSPFGYFFGIPSQKYVLGDVQLPGSDSVTISSRMDFIEGHYLQNSSSDAYPPRRFIRPAPRNLRLEETNFLYEILSIGQQEMSFWDNNNNTLKYSESERSTKTGHSNGVLDIIWKFYTDLVTFNENNYNPAILDNMFAFMPKSGSIRSKSCELLAVCFSHGALKRLPYWVIKIYQVFSAKLSFMPLDFKGAVLQGMGDETKCVPKFSGSCSESPFTIALKSYMNLLPDAMKSKSVPKRKQAMYL